MAKLVGVLIVIGFVGAMVAIPAALKIGPFQEPDPPRFFVSPRELTVSPDSPTEYSISNIGELTLHWRVDSSPSWITMSRSSGSMDGKTTVKVLVKMREDTKEVFRGTIEISSNGGRGSLRIIGRPR